MKFMFFSAMVMFSLQATGARTTSDGIDFDSFKKIIQEKDLRTVDEALAELPERFRSSYTLMFKSRSLQKASYEGPRVIMFGRTAKFVVAFGDGHLKGGNSIESYQVDPKTGRFLFRTIEFSENGDKRPVVSEVNPTRCTGCHGSEPLPIWGKYAEWDGAYGSTKADNPYPGALGDDDFGQMGLGCLDEMLDENDQVKKPTRAGCEAQYEEFSRFLEWKRKAPGLPRYSKLVWRYDYQSAPFQPSKKWMAKNSSNLKDRFGEFPASKAEAQGIPANNVNFRPSYRLEIMINTLLDQWLAHRVMEMKGRDLWLAERAIFEKSAALSRPLVSLMESFDKRPFPVPFGFWSDHLYYSLDGALKELGRLLAERDPALAPYMRFKTLKHDATLQGDASVHLNEERPLWDVASGTEEWKNFFTVLKQHK